MRTVCGSEFHTVGAEYRKARLEKSVLMNGLSNGGNSEWQLNSSCDVSFVCVYVCMCVFMV